ncbi:MAG: aminotransferase class I/II-fold pyridoxal phosphate-dependent enzyme [Lentimicrobium sp.]
MDKLIWPKWPVIDQNSLQYTSSSLMNGRFSVSGNEDNSISFIRIVEKEMEQFTKSKFAILTANGSSALLLAMQSLNIGIGDEVILPVLTWVGVATAILRVGATPVFIDISSTNPHMDFKEIENKVTQKTKAIIAPHLYASLINIGLLKKQFPNIPIIEDASHCSGLYERILRPDQFEPDIIIFSLQATKPLTCGEGGVVLINKKEQAENILSLRNDSRIYHNANPEKLVLKPGNYHGANLNLSDIQAALLLDQMEKQNATCLKRTSGFLFFLNLIENDANVDITYSKELINYGNFYGIPCKLNCTDNEFSEFRMKIVERINLNLWNPYTPIPFSQLYKPYTIKSYAICEKYEKENFSNAFKWIRNRFIIPHQVFLAENSQLEALYKVFSKKPFIRQHKFKSNSDGVSVIILTKNRKEQLINAINSVLEQDFGHNIEILLIGDNCNYLQDFKNQKLPENISMKSHNVSLDQSFEINLTVHRVATLRNFAVKIATQNCICFLDDDNLWEVDHLSSLMETLQIHQCKASHSWRKLYLNNGTPWMPSIWPWIGSDIPQEALLTIYNKLGMLDLKSNILKDQFKAVYNNRDFGTIDMGAWLFKRELFDIISFKTDYTKEEENCLVTEDDQLLLDLKRLNFQVYPTRKATLKYYLGGFSNLYNNE